MLLNIFVKNSYFEEWVFTVLHTDFFHLSFCSLKFVCWDFIAIIINILWIDLSINFKGLILANKARWPVLALTAILDMWWGDKPARWSENVEVFSSFIIFFFKLTQKKNLTLNRYKTLSVYFQQLHRADHQIYSRKSCRTGLPVDQ